MIIPIAASLRSCVLFDRDQHLGRVPRRDLHAAVERANLKCGVPCDGKPLFDGVE